ncbi:MAG: IS630 family transposase [Janthinobacterium lividum]
MSQYTSEQLVFVDESGCDTRAGTRKMGWSPRGLTPEKIVLLARSERYSILPAYTVEGILTADVYTGTTDTEVFAAWIEEKLLPRCSRFPAPRSVVVMDNASIHHSERITELFEEAGVVLVYLPPYSPDYNPIEEFFAQLKACIRKHWCMWEAGDFGEVFEEFLAWCIRLTGSNDAAARGHFEHCGYSV